MKKVIENPVKVLSIEELSTFKIAIDKNFSTKEKHGEIIEDNHTIWWDLYTQCLNYAYHNHLEITKDYPKMESRTYGDMVIIMINEELEKR